MACPFCNTSRCGEDLAFLHRETLLKAPAGWEQMELNQMGLEKAAVEKNSSSQTFGFFPPFRSQQHAKVVPWMRKTEYISTEFNRYGVSNEKPEVK